MKQVSPSRLDVLIALISNMGIAFFPTWSTLPLVWIYRAEPTDQRVLIAKTVFAVNLSISIMLLLIGVTICTVFAKQTFGVSLRGLKLVSPESGRFTRTGKLKRAALWLPLAPLSVYEFISKGPENSSTLEKLSGTVLVRDVAEISVEDVV